MQDALSGDESEVDWLTPAKGESALEAGKRSVR